MQPITELTGEQQYLQLAQHILDTGTKKDDRTGTGTLSIFGAQLRFDLNKGFPLLTTKRVHLRSIIHELLWFLKGDTNIKYLKDNNVSIWDEWAVTEEQSNRWENLDWLGINYASAIHCPPSFEGWSWEDIKTWFISADLNPEDCKIEKPGDLGPVYSKQWRDWVGPDGRHHDQISNVIEQLRNDPDSRRIIVSAWNVGELDKMALAPCHSFFQFYTRELTEKERVSWLRNNDERRYQEYNHTLEDIDEDEFFDEAGVPARQLSCQFYMRSTDVFLGKPFNIASYALLTHMVAQQVNMTVGDLVYTGGDVHLYSNHLEQMKLQLTREPRPFPKLVIHRKPDSLFDYHFEDFGVEGYDPHPAIKAPVAI